MYKPSLLDFKNSKSGLNELKNRVFFVIGSLVIFRVGSFIPIPSINVIVLTKLFEQQRGTIIEMFNMFSGGALSRASIFALGIIPYISASIIIQLLTMLNSKLSEIKKDGELGKRKINQYTCYSTLILAMFQSIGIATGLPNIPGMKNLVINPGFSFYLTTIVSMVCGTMFLMWLGEKITEKGMGNGISVIVFSGIVSNLPSDIKSIIKKTWQGDLHFFVFLIVIIFVFLITFFVVFFELGQRRIVVSYAKRQQGHRIYITQNTTHLPLKVNMAGVIPAIFASSFILFPATIVSWFRGRIAWNWLTKLLFYLQPNQPFYILLYTTAIIFFCFFYTMLTFNSRETADNLKKSGAFIPGIRPGEKTAKYIGNIITRLTLINAIYITFICLIPEFMRSAIKIPLYFGGTSLLIVVVVIMDFMSQLQTLIMSNQYDSVLKKANLKGYNY